MKIAVLGTGVVGQTVAARLAELGHEVTVGTRDVAATRARDLPDAPWSGGAVAMAGFAEAAAGAELVVNASSGQATLEVLEAAGAANLAGKVLLDIANALDFSGDAPALVVKDDSLAEQVQRAFPDARVVKSLNTMNADLMVRPRALADGDHTVFVSGDDADAKHAVAALLADFGHRDIVDLGGLSTARGTEMLLPVWLHLYQTLGTAAFNVKIVR